MARSDPARLAAAYTDEWVTVYLGDCLDVLADIADGSVDSIVTDPPYGLDFMGKHWDTGAVAFNPRTWTQCLRVLKPGGHLVAFGGTRTWHRLACAVEDAGFEIRDNLAWIFGQGFPKSLNVSNDERFCQCDRGLSRCIDGNTSGISLAATNECGSQARRGWPVCGRCGKQSVVGVGTSLKPAHEPIILARKPLQGTIAANVLTHGTGALNIDGCRVGVSDADRAAVQGREWVAENLERTAYGKFDGDGKRRAIDYAPAGRWPANVVLDPAAAAELDRQSGTLHSQDPATRRGTKGTSLAFGDRIPGDNYSDSGGASRFFYTAKARRDERPTHDGVSHPTVKPVELIRWLIRLITPPGGTVLDPFAGTGTTGEAAIRENLRAILIEQEADYLPLITNRLHKPIQLGLGF